MFLAAGSLADEAALPPPAEGLVDFQRQIEPILRKN
jgi:hypothetical protein